MKLTTFTLTVALGALAAPVAFACPDHDGKKVWTDGTVRAHLIANGYTNINDIEFEEGVWTADATSADGSLVEVTLDADTGKIIPDEGTATVGRAQVIANLTALGYTNLHDIDFENGVWKVEANDKTGADVELKVDPNTGKLLGSDLDAIQD
jgi:roadblock/LC7 domain-containing protein